MCVCSSVSVFSELKMGCTCVGVLGWVCMCQIVSPCQELFEKLWNIPRKNCKVDQVLHKLYVNDHSEAQEKIKVILPHCPLKIQLPTFFLPGSYINQMFTGASQLR